MKHHKVKGVWKHKPDALPLPDAPSTGVKRKKGSLEKASKKHLWDIVKQVQKDIYQEVKYLSDRGIPTVHRSGPGWVSADCYFAESSCDYLIKQVDKVDEVLRELEGRME